MSLGAGEAGQQLLVVQAGVQSASHVSRAVLHVLGRSDGSVQRAIHRHLLVCRQRAPPPPPPPLRRMLLRLPASSGTRRRTGRIYRHRAQPGEAVDK